MKYYGCSIEQERQWPQLREAGEDEDEADGQEEEEEEPEEGNSGRKAGGLQEKAQKLLAVRQSASGIDPDAVRISAAEAVAKGVTRELLAKKNAESGGGGGDLNGMLVREKKEKMLMEQEHPRGNLRHALMDDEDGDNMEEEGGLDGEGGAEGLSDEEYYKAERADPGLGKKDADDDEL